MEQAKTAFLLNGFFNQIFTLYLRIVEKNENMILISILKELNFIASFALA